MRSNPALHKQKWGKLLALSVFMLSVAVLRTHALPSATRAYAQRTHTAACLVGALACDRSRYKSECRLGLRGGSGDNGAEAHVAEHFRADSSSVAMTRSCDPSSNSIDDNESETAAQVMDSPTRGLPGHMQALSVNGDRARDGGGEAGLACLACYRLCVCFCVCECGHLYAL
jgi:hypothetical protein